MPNVQKAIPLKKNKNALLATLLKPTEPSLRRRKKLPLRSENHRFDTDLQNNRFLKARIFLPPTQKKSFLEFKKTCGKIYVFPLFFPDKGISRVLARGVDF